MSSMGKGWQAIAEDSVVLPWHRVKEILKQAKAEAWDEGEKAGHWNTTERMGGPMNNPYRKE